MTAAEILAPERSKQNGNVSRCAQISIHVCFMLLATEEQGELTTFLWLRRIQMGTILIVLLVLFLLGGGGWGYSRWRRN